MTKRTALKSAVAAAVLFGMGGGTAWASGTLYNNRAVFESTLGTFLTDGYDESLYGVGFQIHTDAAMSAFFGETDYQTTGFSNWNFTLPNSYCAGCNGSFLLSFTTTSVGTANGVFGVGLDILGNSSSLPYTAYVTYGDGSTENIALTPVAQFWGITSNQLIKSIHFGLPNGGSTIEGGFQIDNLTIGNAIPAPGALALLGLAGLAVRRRRRA